jgi:hypothetical protein
MADPMPRPRTILPPLAWPFVVFAVLDVIWYALTTNFAPNPPAADVLAYWLQVFPSVASILLPAALLTRHPDATWRARTLLIGTLVLAASQGLVILSDPLQFVFAVITPATQDQPVVLSSLLFEDLTSLLIAVGLACIALGLSRARRHEDRSEPVTGLIVVVLAIVGTIDGIVSTSRLDISGLRMSLGLAVYLVSSAVFGVVRIVAWGYLSATVWRGALAREAPTRGWRLASVGGGAVILALVLLDLVDVFNITNGALVLSYVTIGSYALGHLLLLVAFAVGLPSFDDAEDDDVEDDDEDEDQGYEDDDDL